jgi:hypothetical protein
MAFIRENAKSHATVTVVTRQEDNLSTSFCPFGIHSIFIIGENMPDTETRSQDTTDQMHCWKCGGVLSPETEVDLYSGVSLQTFVCLICGRRWHGGKKSTVAVIRNIP